MLELILISGEGSEAWVIWGMWSTNSLSESVVATIRSFEIEIAPWDDTKWALGASAIVLQASLSRSHDQAPAFLQLKNRLSVVTSLAAK